MAIQRRGGAQPSRRGRPTDVSFSIISGGTVPVVAAGEEILGAIQTSGANGGESQADCHRVSGRSERFSGVQEQVDQRPSCKPASWVRASKAY
jgi:hypothetical protein